MEQLEKPQAVLKDTFYTPETLKGRHVFPLFCLYNWAQSQAQMSYFIRARDFKSQREKKQTSLFQT